MKSCRNSSQRTHPINPFGPLPHVSVCFVLFGCIWDSLLHYNTQFKTGQTCAKVRATKSRRTFRNERTRSTPLDPKLTFWCVHTIWVHSGQFGSLTKLGVKQAELVQKFVPRSRVGIFRNERTRSTPLDPKLTFRSVSYYLGAFGTIWLPYEIRCKTGQN